MAMPILTVEAAFGDAWNVASPTWVDITNWVRHDPPIRISRSTSRISRPRPGTLALTLDNTDQRFDPDNASGAYANDLVPMVPVRVRSRLGQPLQFADFPGVNGVIKSDYSTPVGQEATLTIRVRSDDYGTDQTLIAPDDTGWRLMIGNFGAEGECVMSFLATGISLSHSAAPIPVLDGADVWLRCVLDKYVTGGVATFRARFYYSTTDTDDESLVSWTFLAADTTTGTTSISSVAAYQLGLNSADTEDFAGRIYSASLYSGVAGDGQYLRNSYATTGYAISDYTTAITGEITLTTRIRRDDYTPTAPQMLGSQEGATPNHYWYLSTAGLPILTRWVAGTPFDTFPNTTLGSVGASDNTTDIWVRVHQVLDNGGGSRVTKFYYSLDATDTEASVTWTQLGATVTAAATAAADASTTAHRVGSTTSGFTAHGRIYSYSARAGDPTAALVYNPKFYDTAQWTVGEDAGDTGTDTQGNIWTLSGDARIHSGTTKIWNPKFYDESEWTVGEAASDTAVDDQGVTWTLNDDVTIVANDTLSSLFRGFASEWRVNTEDFKDSTTTLVAVDGLSVLEMLRVESPFSRLVASLNPKAWYRFSEPVGATTLLDQSGNGYHGTISGVTLGQSGDIATESDKAGDFDSTDYVALPSEVGVTSGDITIMVMFNTTQNPAGFGYLWTQGRLDGTSWDNATGVISLRLRPSAPNDIEFVVYPIGGPQDGLDTAAVNDGAWRQVVGVISGTDAILYSNGASVDTDTIAGSATWNPLQVRIGDIGGVTTAYDGLASEVIVWHSALSAANIALLYTTATAPYDSQLTSARITAILDAAGWESALRDLDTGLTTMDELTATGSALTLIYQAVDSENGAAWMTGAGKVWFGNRNWRNTSSYAATFSNDGSDTAYQGLSWRRDQTALRTVAQVTDRNGAVTEYIGSTETTYGPRVISRTTYTESATEPYDYATWLANEYGNSRSDADLLLVAGAATGTAAWAEILSRELGDLVNVEVKPVGGTAQNDFDMFVEEIEHTIAVDRWTLRLGVANARDQRGFVLDDDVLGELDGVGRLGW